MGTYYPLLKDENQEIGINEASNKLKILSYNTNYNKLNHKYLVINTSWIKPEKMLAILLKGIQVCSYWMDTDELKEKVNSFLEKEIY